MRMIRRGMSSARAGAAITETGEVLARANPDLALLDGADLDANGDRAGRGETYFACSLGSVPPAVVSSRMAASIRSTAATSSTRRASWGTSASASRATSRASSASKAARCGVPCFQQAVVNAFGRCWTRSARTAARAS